MGIFQRRWRKKWLRQVLPFVTLFGGFNYNFQGYKVTSIWVIILGHLEVSLEGMFLHGFNLWSFRAMAKTTPKKCTKRWVLHGIYYTSRYHSSIQKGANNSGKWPKKCGFAGVLKLHPIGLGGVTSGRCIPYDRYEWSEMGPLVDSPT